MTLNWDSIPEDEQVDKFAEIVKRLWSAFENERVFAVVYEPDDSECVLSLSASHPDHVPEIIFSLARMYMEMTGRDPFDFGNQIRNLGKDEEHGPVN